MALNLGESMKKYLIAAFAARDGYRMYAVDDNSHKLATFDVFHEYLSARRGYSNRELLEQMGYAIGSDILNLRFEMRHGVKWDLSELIRKDAEARAYYQAIRSDIVDYMEDHRKAKRKESEANQEATKRSKAERATYKKPPGDLSKAKVGSTPTVPERVSGFGPTQRVRKEDILRYIKLNVDGEMEDAVAEAMADHALGFFGYQNMCVDNSLEPQDRSVFYDFESYGLLRTVSEETTLWDGRDWRIHYWVWSHDIFDKVERLKADEAQVDEDLYSHLPEEMWKMRSSVEEQL